ncbi:hypothetical protein SAMN04488527_1724 [Aliiroseovarius crassostreae]|nr:DUF6010 family protein [Aliiroseovarius crassostreae]SFU98660.1 hypothetical protein SAMN04488527_1724 [Aliiroseovarius crassostreae]
MGERHTRWWTTIPAWSVIGLGALAVHLVLPVDASQTLAALLLTLIAGVYIGFAVNDGRLPRILVEGSVAIGFVAFAGWALLYAPILLPLGYIFHAGWDFLHHTSIFNMKMPKWYVPACVVFDVIVGLGLWAIWLIH